MHGIGQIKSQAGKVLRLAEGNGTLTVGTEVRGIARAGRKIKTALLTPGKNTWQRYESKYLVDEELALRLRRYCQRRMEFDPYSVNRPNFAYPIQSYYFDTPGQDILRSVLEQHADRLKLRVRTYRAMTAKADSLPAFFEIKRKIMGIIHKKRVQVPREETDRLMWEDAWTWSDPSGSASVRASDLEAFLRLRCQMNAKPVIGVFYTREAYESPSDGVRISFDRNLHYSLWEVRDGKIREMWWPVPIRGVIFEIKFKNTYPSWIREMVGTSDLVREGVCKFLMCIQASRGIDPNRQATRMS